MKIQDKVPNDTMKWKEVTDKENMILNRALGEPLCDRGEGGGVREGAKLFAVSKVGSEPI